MRQQSEQPLFASTPPRFDVEHGAPAFESSAPVDLKAEPGCCPWHKGFLDSLLYVDPDITEHPAFRRTKIALLTIGVAVVLCANAAFLGYMTPPEPPAVLLSELNPNFLTQNWYQAAVNKTLFNYTGLFTDPEGGPDYDEITAADLQNYDFGQLSVADYAAQETAVDPRLYCDNVLLTAFSVVNGSAFAFSLATLFLVAVLPVFIRKNEWDVYLARVGACFTICCLLLFLGAFILAGFVSVGVGSTWHCQTYHANLHRHDATKQRTFAVSAYTIIGVSVALVLVVTIIAIKRGN